MDKAKGIYNLLKKFMWDNVVGILGIFLLGILCVWSIVYLKGGSIDGMKSLDFSIMVSDAMIAWLWICCLIFLVITLLVDMITFITHWVKLYRFKKQVFNNGIGDKEILKFCSSARQKDKLSGYENKVLSIIKNKDKVSCNDVEKELNQSPELISMLSKIKLGKIGEGWVRSNLLGVLLKLEKIECIKIEI